MNVQINRQTDKIIDGRTCKLTLKYFKAALYCFRTKWGFLCTKWVAAVPGALWHPAKLSRTTCLASVFRRIPVRVLCDTARLPTAGQPAEKISAQYPVSDIGQQLKQRHNSRSLITRRFRRRHIILRRLTIIIMVAAVGMSHLHRRQMKALLGQWRACFLVGKADTYSFVIIFRNKQQKTFFSLFSKK